MTAVSFSGYFLLGLGPGLVIFFTVVAPKSFLVIVTLASAFFWLIALIIIALLWRGFLPLGSNVGPYIPLLISAVAIQELIRAGYLRLYQKAEVQLDAVAARQSKPRLSVIDRMQIGLASGLGHGSAHAAFFFLSLLTPALGPATYYVDSCPQMPFFLVAALMSSSFLIIHTFGMVIAFDAYMSQQKGGQFFVPSLHLLASLLTLTNFASGGCVWGTSLVLLCAVCSLAYCGKVVWERTGHSIVGDR